ncbi:methyl-accepting chemotaxis protein [Photobacterium sp. GB-27]|uniref:methyl-accepting chemotaxis protein n=1 Tax=unclassified Photobacterium TaxID=2628852 RepID=UPI000D158E39|nr:MULTISPECIES: methyl-accepting chemotaxis protein [unclassified Photobacterium]PSV27805.1 methyl-accepting chemotaxis protein [Photobacterium sp. GB-56]PSV32053.1 methyl-accepting chemotaxis protein [Photobacterium sp. GB-72]PSV32781.1 methyl-accepting chemotaxis protein [Photobacterium sp. GB-27]PSV41431.1 methyl-accepting chemotaxis protein [Photobacterium sp. GB-36]PSV56825.1 methyl-accepting chemotaxis protein [Photobacterium sp. GB-3]
MQLSLKQKLISASLSAVVLMATVLTWLAASNLQQQTNENILDRVQSVATTATSGIEDWINIRRSITSSVKEPYQKADLVPFLQQARDAGGFDDIYYGTVAGQMLRSHPERNRADYDPRTRPWYGDAVNSNKQVITTAYQDAITNALLVTIAEPIRHSGALAGVIGADVLIDQLINDVISLNVGDNAHAMLIDKKNGTFLAHSDKSLLLKPIANYSNQLNMGNIEQSANTNRLEQISIKGVDKLFYFANIPNSDWIFGLEMDKSTEEASYYSLLTELIITAIVITLIVVMAVAWLVNYLLRDLNRVSKALAEIANGEGDLTQRLEPRSQDEVGKLALNFNQFVGNMHQMVTRLRHVSESLNHQSHITASQAEERSTRIQHQQDEINMVATAINEMAAATQEIAANAENTARTSEQTVTASNHGATQVNQSQQSISTLAQEVDTATSVISELNHHAQSITTILSTIQGIAEQTNLLALNAAIEAARAGEQGRGFAVVADEVRVLSQRTHASTQEIQQMIETLQKTTGQAVNIMEDSRHLSETSVDDANAAAVSLSQITTAVTTINDMATQIASAAEEQSSVTSEITRNTEGIRDVSNELAVEANEAAKQAAELSNLSHELQQEISRFKL